MKMQIRDLIRIVETTDLPLSDITVYVDMDGVLVDTYNEIARQIGVEHYTMLKGPDWEDFYSKQDGYHLFRDLPAFPTAAGLLNVVKKYAGKYSLLSTPLNYDVPGSIKGKEEWLTKHRYIQPERVIFEAAKEKYAVSNGRPNVLIDDSPSQLSRWKAAGGIAIKYQGDGDTVEDVDHALAEISKTNK